MEDARDLKSCSEKSTGSIPVLSTFHGIEIWCRVTNWIVDGEVMVIEISQSRYNLFSSKELTFNQKLHAVDNFIKKKNDNK